MRRRRIAGVRCAASPCGAAARIVTTLPSLSLVVDKIASLFSSTRTSFVNVKSRPADLALLGTWLADGLVVLIERPRSRQATSRPGSRICAPARCSGSGSPSTSPAVSDRVSRYDVVMADPRELVGRTIAERYDILALVGTGGMGAVYRARDRELDEVIAFKVIRAELADAPALVASFRREVKLARRVTHPNVARIFELGRAGDLTFCTMELVVGEPLTRRLAAVRRLPIAEAVAITSAASATR